MEARRPVLMALGIVRSPSYVLAMAGQRSAATLHPVGETGLHGSAKNKYCANVIVYPHSLTQIVYGQGMRIMFTPANVLLPDHALPLDGYSKFPGPTAWSPSSAG